MSAPRYRDRWPTYAKQWDAMQRTRLTAANEAAERILAHKARYQAVEAKTGVPWWWIGCTHYRESDLDFDTQLAQGDPLGKVSRNVPTGMGPYFGTDAWERAAIEGLEHDNLQKVADWGIGNPEKAIYWWERWNGWGFFYRGVPSSYVWGGTNIEVGGRYVRDHEWVDGVKDPRLGCAAILKSLAEMDKSIVLVRETDDLVPPMPQPQPFPKPEPAPVPTPTPTPTPQIDPQLLKQVADMLAPIVADAIKKAPSTTSTLLSGLVTGSPFIAIGLMLLQVFLTNADVMGMPGVGGTPTANNTAGGLLAMFVAGIANWLRPKEPAK